VALTRRTDVSPTPAVQAFQDTLLGFLAEAETIGDLGTDVQVLHRSPAP